MGNSAISVILSENTDFYQFILNLTKLMTSLLNAVFHSESPWLPPTLTFRGCDGRSRNPTLRMATHLFYLLLLGFFT